MQSHTIVAGKAICKCYAHEPAVCPYSEGGQPRPGPHQQERSQRVEGSNPASAPSNFTPGGGKPKPPKQLCHQRTKTAPSNPPPGGNPGDPQACKDRGRPRTQESCTAQLPCTWRACACTPPQHHSPGRLSCLPFPVAHVHFSTADFFFCFNHSLPPYL